MPDKFILVRDVTRKECPWLERDFKKGENVFECMQYTYGRISEKGMGCTENLAGKYPFFELTKDSIIVSKYYQHGKTN